MSLVIRKMLKMRERGDNFGVNLFEILIKEKWERIKDCHFLLVSVDMFL